MADLHYLTCRRCGEYLQQHDFPYCPPCNLYLAYRAFPHLAALLVLAPSNSNLIVPLESDPEEMLQDAVGYDDAEALIWE